MLIVNSNTFKLDNFKENLSHSTKQYFKISNLKYYIQIEYVSKIKMV